MRTNNTEMRGQLADGAVRDYLLAGDATITVESPSGVRFTYRVRVSDDGQVHFVSVLTGSDNESSFSYLGTIRGGHTYWHSRKSRLDSNAPSARGFAWLWNKVQHDGLSLSPMRVYHEGRCGRCGHKLTVPESVTTGYGPECAGKLGIERHSPPARRAPTSDTGVEDERAMQRLEAEGDREQTAREERAKADFKANVEQAFENGMETLAQVKAELQAEGQPAEQIDRVRGAWAQLMKNVRAETEQTWATARRA
jgi:hypothetical protein